MPTIVIAVYVYRVFVGIIPDVEFPSVQACGAYIQSEAFVGKLPEFGRPVCVEKGSIK